MPHIPHPDDVRNEPIVVATLRRLKLASVVVVSGIALCIVMAGVMTLVAFRSGTQAALAAAQSVTDTPAHISVGAMRSALQVSGPSVVTYALLAIGFLVIGAAMYVAVRRPYAAAYQHAMELARANIALETANLETIAALNATVEARDTYTSGHSLRVTLMSLLIGTELGMSEADLDELRHAATFHDIGKIAVPDAVLNKMGPLTDLEYEQMKLHSMEGARICAKVGVLRPSVEAIMHHHERMDGRGYPHGLRGEQIPMASRIIAVADTWDAITSDRPYRAGQPATIAFDEVRRVAGSQLDPDVVEAFVRVLSKDPWMFGLTPHDLIAEQAAPGQYPDVMPRSGQRDISLTLTGTRTPADPSLEIDWSTGFDDELLPDESLDDGVWDEDALIDDFDDWSEHDSSDAGDDSFGSDMSEAA